MSDYALDNCPTCNAGVSKAAKACPSCGQPMATYRQNRARDEHFEKYRDRPDLSTPTRIGYWMIRHWVLTIMLAFGALWVHSKIFPPSEADRMESYRSCAKAREAFNGTKHGTSCESLLRD